MTDRFSPRDFMRARRPELYSDSISRNEVVVDRAVLEFHLHTLTQRKDELRFEHFCRHLAQKELCPNLTPQTGPTGGGDSKVDSETYPVAESIAERWYIGEPALSSKERWAFAFSAKEDWVPKAKDDVRKIAETGRAYARIYFMTNQAARDKDKSQLEDDLSNQWNVPVRILDRTWILDKVIANHRWDVIFQTLDIDVPKVQSTVPGPLDVERRQDLDELERQLADSGNYQYATYQLVEDCLQAALLARGLNLPRIEVDGRFDRAERIARQRRSDQQLFRILYQRAWTANWWFDDYAELNRIYELAEPIALNSESVWDLDKLSNLWNAGSSWQWAEPGQHDNDGWSERTQRLRAAWLRHSQDQNRPTAALWAETQLVLLDVVEAVRNNSHLVDGFSQLKEILNKIDGRLDYPLEPVVEIIQELGAVMPNDEAYDEISELIIDIQRQRIGEAEEGRLRLKRGIQKLQAENIYDSIDQLAKSQFLLAKEEEKEDFVRALAGTALAYEAAGLLWAARANLVVALDRVFSEYFKSGTVAPQAIPLLRKLIWTEMQLGRCPCVLGWFEMLNVVCTSLQLSDSKRQQLDDECRLMDVVLGILVLRTRFTDLYQLGRLPELLGRMTLQLARGAALFSLGHESTFRTESGETDRDLNEFVSLWSSQPAAADLPAEAEWHTAERVTMRTAIMGCEIEFVVQNETSSILLAEALLAFLESFFSTGMKAGLYAMRPYLKVELRPSEFADIPFGHNVLEDECGETTVVVVHQKLSATALVSLEGYQESLLGFLARVLAELHVAAPLEAIEELFARHRAQDRASLVAKSPIALSNLTKSPKYHLEDWFDNSFTERLEVIRTVAWQPSCDPTGRPSSAAEVSDETTEQLFGVDALKHRDVSVLSPINLALWDKAGWRGMGHGYFADDRSLPDLILMFKDVESSEKIFRGWKKRVGDVDVDEWIGLTLLTGIDKRNPFSYRLAIGVNEDVFERQPRRKGIVACAYRMRDMDPADSTNLDNFLQLYKTAGRYRLVPGLLARGQAVVHPYANELAIEKRRLRIMPVWQVSINDQLCAALDGITDPIIPADVTDDGGQLK